jgi:transposase
MKLARLARAGELEPIYVPDEKDEAMRDLVRAREDAVCMQRQTRQRLQALLLRNEIRYVGKSARLENPRGTLLIRHTPATQTLARGSSVTHNSLEANQRPHISLIDRRHQAPLRCPKSVM